MSSPGRLLAVTLLGLVGLAGSAAASPESERLFREGKKLLKANKVAEACDAFASSQQLAPAVGTLVNLAMCREQQGQTATAWKLYLEAKELADTLKDERRGDAMQRMVVAIESKLSYLTITVAPAAQVEGLVIKRNGIAVDRAQWNTPVALDPGSYVFEASAPKFKSSSTSQTLATKAKLDVVIEALVAEPVAPDPGVGPRAKDPVVGTAPDPTPPSTRPEASEGTPLILPVVAQSALPHPQRRYLGAGMSLGTASVAHAPETKPLVGVRLLGSLPVPGGAVRAIGSITYTRVLQFESDETISTLYGVGLSADYVWMPVANLGFAAGAGLGQDRDYGDGEAEVQTAGWWTVRASPLIVRLLQGHAEAGLHIQYVKRSDGATAKVFFLAFDLFPR